MRFLTALWVARVPSLAFVVLGFFWGAFAASVPDIKAGLGVNDAVFGLLLIGNPVGLVTAMWLAPRIDRALGARALQAVTAFFTLCFVIPGFAPTPVVFGLGMVLLGLASGLTDVLMNARVSELEGHHKRPLMNLAHGMFSVSYAASAFATGLLRDAAQPPWVALGLAAAAGFALTFFLRIKVELAEDEATSARGMPWLVLVLCGIIVLLAFMTEGTVETWSALHIERTLGGDPLAGALGPVMLGVTMAVGRLSGQGISEHFRDEAVIVAATLLAAVGIFIAAAAPTPAVAYVGFGIFGLGISVIGPLGLALVGRLVPTRLRTEAIAKTAVIGFSGFFIAPMIMGTLSELYSLRVAYGAVGFLVLTTIGFVVALMRVTAKDGLSEPRDQRV